MNVVLAISGRNCVRHLIVDPTAGMAIGRKAPRTDGAGCGFAALRRTHVPFMGRLSDNNRSRHIDEARPADYSFAGTVRNQAMTASRSASVMWE